MEELPRRVLYFANGLFYFCDESDVPFFKSLRITSIREQQYQFLPIYAVLPEVAFTLKSFGLLLVEELSVSGLITIKEADSDDSDQPNDLMENGFVSLQMAVAAWILRDKRTKIRMPFLSVQRQFVFVGATLPDEISEVHASLMILCESVRCDETSHRMYGTLQRIASQTRKVLVIARTSPLCDVPQFSIYERCACSRNVTRRFTAKDSDDTSQEHLLKKALDDM